MGVISVATCDEILALVEQVHPPLVTLAAVDAELERKLAVVMKAIYAAAPHNPNAFADVVLNIGIMPLRQQVLAHMRGVGLDKLLHEDYTPVSRGARGDDWAKHF